MYFTEEDNAQRRDGRAGTARGSTTLGRPILVCVDRKSGRVHASEMQMKLRPLNCCRRCSGH